uniref:Integrator complex subunit 1 R3 domain-containing protein n=1 Tax=Hanusia phi TaxID=3032 RepID=A0A7S0HSW9_9CRYP|mmetsp:Transcript_34513/g.77825  ORF Transcript_34513/g.77825 Transcript_34513/m.77825 type:complete len:486 (+) Transcript_34513:155-1612(+)
MCESLDHEQRGVIRMGRIQLLLEGISNDASSASAVRDCLLDILIGGARVNGLGGCEEEGEGKRRESEEDDRVDGSIELRLAALDLYERLRMALPLQLSARAAGGLSLLPQQELLHVIQTLKGDSRKTSLSSSLIRQTAKLDRLLQNVLIFLQDKLKASDAIVVARQIACAHPALIANHMLSIRSLCSGKAMLRLADFVERNGPQLFSHVITILEAAKPFTLNSPSLSLVLEEFFFLYANTARREDDLKPLLSKFMGLCLSVVKSSSPSAGHVRENIPLLEKLCGWYPDVPELQALLELLNPSSFVKGLGLQELHGASRQVEDISSRLRLRRSIRMIGTGERASEDESSAFRGLTQALEEADALITEEVNLQTLSCLERPLLDLTTARSSSIRILVYRLLLRLARLLPESATRIANKHFLCMCSEDDGVQLSATSFASQMVHISAPTAPKVLRKLLAMARGGSKTAEKELMRAVQSGLEYHCLEAR